MGVWVCVAALFAVVACGGDDSESKPSTPGGAGTSGAPEPGGAGAAGEPAATQEDYEEACRLECARQAKLDCWSYAESNCEGECGIDGCITGCLDNYKRFPLCAAQILSYSSCAGSDAAQVDCMDLEVAVIGCEDKVDALTECTTTKYPPGE
jgi:hypothetical protein